MTPGRGDIPGCQGQSSRAEEGKRKAEASVDGDEWGRRQALKTQGINELVKVSSGSKRKHKEKTEVSAKVKVARILVAVRPVEYARYGVVEGVISGAGVGRRDCECGVIARSWPSWGIGAHGAGLKIKFIILFDEYRKLQVEKCLPGVKIICIINAETRDGTCPGWVELDQVDVVFTEIDPPGLVNVWSVAQNVVVSSRRCQRIPKGWKEERHVVSHSDCGGIMDEEVQIHVYSKEGEKVWDSLCLDACGVRDLSGILDSRARQGVPCMAPRVARLETPSVLPVAGRATYHGGGWLPSKRRDIHVVTPNGFSPTNWCRRKLLVEEWLQVVDFPVSMIKRLSEAEKDDLARNTEILPGKVVASVCSHFSRLPSGSPPGEASDDIKVDLGSDVQPSTTMGENRGPVLELVVDSEDRTAKATKADDAEVPEYLWDDRLLQVLNCEKTDARLKAMGIFRCMLLRWWKRRVTKSYTDWSVGRRVQAKNHVKAHRLVTLEKEKGVYTWTAKGRKQYKSARNQVRTEERKSNDAARDTIRRSSNSTWWEWTVGSTPFFWRWPGWYMEKIRDGTPPCFKGVVPRSLIPQREEKDDRTRAAMKGKIEVPIDKEYLERGLIFSLTSFFSVPKGDRDIRMVYDGTRSGLNEVLYAPWFPLPTVEQLLRSVESGSFMGDNDVGEMFLNFVMHKDLRVYCGVDLTSYFPEKAAKGGDTVWYRWGRCGMGFTNSPYIAVQGITVAEEVIVGDRTDPSNIFRWDIVELNLWQITTPLSHGCVKSG